MLCLFIQLPLPAFLLLQLRVRISIELPKEVFVVGNGLMLLHLVGWVSSRWDWLVVELHLRIVIPQLAAFLPPAV